MSAASRHVTTMTTATMITHGLMVTFDSPLGGWATLMEEPPGSGPITQSLLPGRRCVVGCCFPTAMVHGQVFARGDNEAHKTWI